MLHLPNISREAQTQANELFIKSLTKSLTKNEKAVLAGFIAKNTELQPIEKPAKAAKAKAAKAKAKTAKAKTAKAAKAAETEQAKAAEAFVELVNYSEKSVAVIGESKPIKDLLIELKGRFNRFLVVNGEQTPGWIFSKKREKDVKAAIKPYLLQPLPKGI